MVKGIGSAGWHLSLNDNWTNGCIVLTNTEMDEFMGLVKIGTKIQIEW
jgi:lipoprotein-anchoring transpeptidase ErfK/SrfK